MDIEGLARELNPPQLQAVLHGDGALLVFAGAGSGKTRVITYRVAHLVEARGVAPWRVMAVTFTNKAAGEMRARLAKLVGDERARSLWIATFHATGAKLLRKYSARAGLKADFAIYDDGDQRAVMNRVYDALDLDEKRYPPRATLGAIDRAKQEVLSPADLLSRARGPDELCVAQAYELYEERLAKHNAVDFGDLLSRVVTLLEKNDDVREELRGRFAHVMVDEFQDTNNAQYRMMRAMVGPQKNVCAVGDDDQAIYAWRGADVENIQRFRRDFAGTKVVKLEQNYRSTKRVLRAAGAVISRAAAREEKTLFTNNPEGSSLGLIECEGERDEARVVAERVKGALSRGVPPREVAVFYRIHAQSRALEEAMIALNLPYKIVGGMRFYERAEVKDVLAYLRLAINPDDDVQLQRVINVPSRKIGKTTVDRLAAHASAKKTSMWRLIVAGDHPEDLGGPARNALRGFWQLVRQLESDGKEHAGAPSELAERVLNRTGYRAMLEAKDDPENDARAENVAELVGSMAEYEKEAENPTLQEYLERVTLSEEVSEAGAKAEKVSLMTVHSAKGLEFEQVFLTGMEDGMFPYKGTEMGAPVDEMEEERRLAYVAITRARKELTFSTVRSRQIFGQTRKNPVSRFLLEIPPEVLAKPLSKPGFGPATAPRVTKSVAGEVLREDGLTFVPDAIEGMPSAEANHGAQGFRKGMRVKHDKWGAGTVRSVSVGAELKVEVYFPALGQAKTLLAQFVRPMY